MKIDQIHKDLIILIAAFKMRSKTVMMSFRQCSKNLGLKVRSTYQIALMMINHIHSQILTIVTVIVTKIKIKIMIWAYQLS